MTDVEILKQYFATAKKPTQEQYWALIDKITKPASLVLPPLRVAVARINYGEDSEIIRPVFVQHALSGQEVWLDSSFDPCIVLLRKSSGRGKSHQSPHRGHPKNKYFEPGPFNPASSGLPAWSSEFLSLARDFKFRLNKSSKLYSPALDTFPSQKMNVDYLMNSFIRITEFAQTKEYKLYGNTTKTVSTGNRSHVNQKFGLAIRILNPYFIHNPEYPDCSMYLGQSKYIYGPITPLIFGIRLQDGSDEGFQKYISVR